MKMFKKPKSKDIKMVAKGFAAFTAGKMVSRGIVGAVPPSAGLKPTYVKGIVGAAALVAAASYSGDHADIVAPAFVGMAVEQIGDIIDSEARKMIASKSNPQFHEKFLMDMVGKKSSVSTVATALNCPGGMNYPMLAAPIEIDEPIQTYMALPYVEEGTFGGA